MQRRWSTKSTKSVARTAVVAVAVLMLAAVGGAMVPRAVAADSAPTRAHVFTRGYDTAKVVSPTFDLDWRTGTAQQQAASKANLETILRVFDANGITGGSGMTGRFAEQNPGEARGVVPNAAHAEALGGRVGG